MKKIVLSTLLLVGFSAAIVAQEQVWTLDECMRYAVENSPAVKKKIHTSDTYKAEHASAVAQFFPQVSANIGGQYNFGRSIDPATNVYNNVTTFDNSYGAALRIPVFTGGQLINEWLKSKSNRRMGVNDIQKAKDDLALETMQAFLDVVYYQGTIKMAEEKLAESKQTLYKTQRQSELGLKSGADIAQFEAQVAADDYTLTHQQNLFDAAVVKLKEKMNYPADMEIRVDTVVPEVSLIAETENVLDIFDYASRNNPTALQADFQWKESKYNYRISKGQLLPSIYFDAGISTNYFKTLNSEETVSSFGSQFRNNRGEYLAISVSIPLFSGLTGIKNARTARNNMRIAEETKTEVLRQLQSAIEQAVLDREGYAKEAIQMEKKVKSDAIAYRVTERKYEEGLMSALDLQTSGNTLLTSKADLLQRKLLYIMKCKLVDYYKGKPLY